MEILTNFSEEMRSNYNLTKAFLTTLLPYPSKKIVKVSDVREVSWSTFFDDLDYDRLKSKFWKNSLKKIKKGVKTVLEFYEFILNYYSKKIMAEEKFKKLLLIFAISEKGLSESEIMSIVLLNFLYYYNFYYKLGENQTVWMDVNESYF